MEDMVKDHKDDISEFQKEANHGGDPDLKAFAQKTLPTLQEHLRLAQEGLAAVK
jgi:putative membrane protein